MSTIKTGTTLTTAYQVEGDTTGALVIQTGSTPTTAVTVGSDQNVTVAGNVTLNNGTADGAQLTLSSSGYSDWNWDNYSGRLRAYYGSTEYFTINSSGNVGIGTSSPTQELHVYRSSGATDIMVEQASSGNAYLHTKNTSREYAVGTRTDALAFYDITADAERMRIDSSGNVDIGTSTTFNSSGYGTVLNLRGSSNAAAYIGDTGAAANCLMLAHTSTVASVRTEDSVPLAFGTGGSERARIDTSGNFYIGNDTTCNLTNFRSKSLASSGYQKIAGGLIIQWGYNSSSSAGVTVTFPIAFPSACVCVNATANNAGGYDTENIQVRSLSTTTFVLQMQNKTTPAYWLAIGY